MTDPARGAHRPDVPDEHLSRLRAICLELPEVLEEQAWAGIRWVIRKKNFAHVVAIDDGWPPAYARAAETDGPAIVLTFRSEGIELEALREAEAPYFKPVWFENIAGLILDDDAGSVDWDEVTGLVTDSYCLLAPRVLSDRVRDRG